MPGALVRVRMKLECCETPVQPFISKRGEEDDREPGKGKTSAVRANSDSKESA